MKCCVVFSLQDFCWLNLHMMIICIMDGMDTLPKIINTYLMQRIEIFMVGQ